MPSLTLSLIRTIALGTTAGQLGEMAVLMVLASVVGYALAGWQMRSQRPKCPACYQRLTTDRYAPYCSQFCVDRSESSGYGM